MTIACFRFKNANRILCTVIVRLRTYQGIPIRACFRCSIQCSPCIPSHYQNGTFRNNYPSGNSNVSLRMDVRSVTLSIRRTWLRNLHVCFLGNTRINSIRVSQVILYSNGVAAICSCFSFASQGIRRVH